MWKSYCHNCDEGENELLDSQLVFEYIIIISKTGKIAVAVYSNSSSCEIVCDGELAVCCNYLKLISCTYEIGLCEFCDAQCLIV